MRTFNKYRENLHTTHDRVFSYNTGVAKIDHTNKVVIPLGWWSVTTSKHINYAAAQLGYTVTDKMYHVTGVDRDGKRFKIVTSNKMHAEGINLWNGTVWEVDCDGKRTMIRRVYNG